MLLLKEGKPVPSKAKMMNFLDIVKDTPHLAVDTESDHKVDPVLFLGFSLAYRSIGMYFPCGHPMEPDANIDNEVYEYAIEVIKDHKLRVFQHAGYDLKVFESLKKPLDGPFACTMVMAHMVNEELRSKDLDSLHKFFTGGAGKIKHPLMEHISQTQGWRYIPTMLLNEYATQDAVATSELYDALRPMFIKEYGELWSE